MAVHTSSPVEGSMSTVISFSPAGQDREVFKGAGSIFSEPRVREHPEAKRTGADHIVRSHLVEYRPLGAGSAYL